MHLPDPRGYGTMGGDIELYYDGRTGTLRRNDGRVDSSQFNVKMLPSSYRVNRRGQSRDAYKIKSVTFERALDLMTNTSITGFDIIRITLIMQNPNGGDTLAMVGTALNRNFSEGNL